uniref:RMI1_N domain-containing protein n=1 Tax=Steinernema glaseri TaxID=37863 RepID=A0A1I8AQ38_9BILA
MMTPWSSEVTNSCKKGTTVIQRGTDLLADPLMELITVIPGDAQEMRISGKLVKASKESKSKSKKQAKKKCGL